MGKNRAMGRLCSVFLILFLHVTLTASSCRGRKPKEQPAKKHRTAFFIFGDSFLDVGNNNFINTTTLDQANFWPYGETYFKFPTGRFSDGRLLPDFIAKYAQLPLIPPFLQPGFRRYYNGVNFASAGAGALVETFQGDVIGLKTQLRYFKKVEMKLRKKVGNNEGKMIVSKAVYLFSIGSNDYMSPFLTNSTTHNSYTDSTFVGMIIGNLTSVIKEIYKRGGRKFAFINLPDLGCLPAMRVIESRNNDSCLEEASLLATLHNKALPNLLSSLKKRLKGFKYSLFDLNTNLRLRMLHPSKYGFKEGEAACCGTGQFRGVYSCGGKRTVKEFELCENPNDYVFWDSFHLTERAYRQLADKMWSATNHSHNGFKVGRTECYGSELNSGDLICGGRRGNYDYALCDNPSDYLFFDGLDRSEKANKQIAELFWNGTSDVTGPNNVKALLD